MGKQRKLKNGLMNNYRPNMPLSELIFKDIFFAIKELINFFRNGFKHRLVLAYPEFPSRNSTFYKICTQLNYNITNRHNRNYFLAIYWEDTTIRIPDNTIEQIAKNNRVINYYARDIGKNLVDRKHEEVFGYSTRVDPLGFQGPCVKKSDQNAAHDGQIVECPIEHPEQGYIYQKLVDNAYNDQFVEDIRVPVIGNTIPLVYLKYKPTSNRFDNFRTTNDLKLPEIHKPNEIFTEEELKGIMDLAKKMNLEFGEMDVLRDRNDEKIYVVDVNNTPTGPSHLPKDQLEYALNLLSSTFKQEFLS